jgi:hypothetical protein
LLSVRAAPLQTGQFILRAGRHSVSLSRALGGHRGLSIGQRSVSRSGGYGVIFNQLYGALVLRAHHDLKISNWKKKGRGVRTVFGVKREIWKGLHNISYQTFRLRPYFPGG